LASDLHPPRAGAIDEADIAVEGLEAAVAALERLTQMLAYNCREEVTFGLRVRLHLTGFLTTQLPLCGRLRLRCSPVHFGIRVAAPRCDVQYAVKAMFRPTHCILFPLLALQYASLVYRLVHVTFLRESTQVCHLVASQGQLMP